MSELEVMQVYVRVRDGVTHLAAATYIDSADTACGKRMRVVEFFTEVAGGFVSCSGCRESSRDRSWTKKASKPLGSRSGF